MRNKLGQSRERLSLAGRGGFTLMELLVVVAIITILVGMVSGTLLGARSAGDEAQIKGDRSEAQKAVDSFNNKSTKSGQWPEQNFGTTYLDPSGGSRKYLDKDGIEITNFTSTRTELNLDATTNVWQADGTVASVALVPGFVLKAPSSFVLQNDEGLNDSNGKALPEFMWVMKINSAGTNSESRTVEVFRLDGTETDGAGNTVAIYKEFN